ncbi:GtrA family protein [Citricoccus sp. SGAir0253]|uniref:GtrA family protein n=1 Tax=Citricoccus sp. SGAir0253 TaxID=2567881 RepID=UPI0010CCD6FB|nr:GtrA family protein [Citricoccus sp. SGAir0253]QCU77511.1 GtrA family protein [Citricoccus sp. SGAir0253]
MNRLVRLANAKISRFALIGAFGAVLNVLIMVALISLQTEYVLAAIVAGELTIITNFIMQEKLVFTHLSGTHRSLPQRFVRSFTFNTLETGARIPFLWFLVEVAHVLSPLAQSVTLLAAFFLRYGYHLKVVYAAQEASSPSARRPVPLPSSPYPDA